MSCGSLHSSKTEVSGKIIKDTTHHDKLEILTDLAMLAKGSETALAQGLVLVL
jgi:hypothetical protein